MKPDLTIVIPTFNSAEFLHPAVESSLEQTHKNIEVIIVDDASGDSTPEYLEWLEKQGHSNVRVIKNGVNMGRSASRNIGNKEAQADIIAVLDADDICGPRRAELTIAKFKAGSVFVHGAAHLMDPVGRDLGMVPTDVFNKDKAIETKSAGIVHSTVAYLKEVAECYRYPEGDASRLGLDDFSVFMKMAFDGVKFDYIPSPLIAYRQNPLGVSAIRDAVEVEKYKVAFLDSLRVPA